MRYDKYFQVAKDELTRVRAEQRENIKEAAALIGEEMKKDAIVQLFGWGANRTFSMELGFRAGGLIQYHQFTPKDLVLRDVVTLEEYDTPGFSEQPGLYEKCWNMYNIDERDMFIIIETDFPTRVTSDIAEYAHKNGHKIVLITNSNIPNVEDTKAYKYADLRIDINVPRPDFALSLDENTQICQVSGLIGNFVAQMITCEIYDYLAEQGIDAGVLLSANIVGADEHNFGLGARFDGRYNS